MIKFSLSYAFQKDSLIPKKSNWTNPNLQSDFLWLNQPKFWEKLSTFDNEFRRPNNTIKNTQKYVAKVDAIKLDAKCRVFFFMSYVCLFFKEIVNICK